MHTAIRDAWLAVLAMLLATLVAAFLFLPATLGGKIAAVVEGYIAARNP